MAEAPGRAGVPWDIRWCADRTALGALAADVLAEVVAQKPHAAIALPTGQTPLGLYGALVQRCRAGELRLDRARFFNLDEYLGLGPQHPLSYAGFLRRQLFDPAGIAMGQVRLLQGDADEPGAECRAYDAAIAGIGGIDLAILGLGVNGHIAFNEPGSAWDTRTHLVQLDAQTRATHAEQAGGRQRIPEKGITMGIATIRAAPRVLLLVTGPAKQAALDALLRGLPDPRWPVTSLLGHARLQVLAEAALRR
jgi:glucosamine-6-phosphate deaminase